MKENKWSQDPNWQVIATVITLITLIAVVLVADTQQWTYGKWLIAIILLLIPITMIFLMVSSIRQTTFMVLSRIGRNIRCLYNTVPAKIIIFTFLYLIILLLVFRFVKLNDQYLAFILVLVTYAVTTIISYSIFSLINIRLNKLKEEVVDLKSRLDEVYHQVDTLELEKVLDKWPEFLQSFSGQRNDLVIPTLLNDAGPPVSVKGLTITVTVPKLLGRPIENIDVSEFEPLLMEIYNKPYKLKLVSLESIDHDANDRNE